MFSMTRLSRQPREDATRHAKAPEPASLCCGASSAAQGSCGLIQLSSLKPPYLQRDQQCLCECGWIVMHKLKGRTQTPKAAGRVILWT